MKTASSSIEIALSEILGPDDVLTPSREDLEAQRSVVGQNYRIDHPAVPKRPLWKRLLGRPERHYHPSIGFYEHIPAWRVKTYVGDDIWKSYYKFAFVRNPWDRQVSFYFYKTRGEKNRRSFEAFMQQGKRAFAESWEIYTIDNRIAVDFLGRYEDLDADFAKVVAQLGLPSSATLPLANSSSKPKGRYREFYNDETKKIVSDWSRREIDLLGYEF
jgi:hypothetical protein